MYRLGRDHNITSEDLIDDNNITNGWNRALLVLWAICESDVNGRKRAMSV